MQSACQWKIHSCYKTRPKAHAKWPLQSVLQHKPSYLLILPPQIWSIGYLLLQKRITKSQARPSWRPLKSASNYQLSNQQQWSSCLVLKQITSHAHQTLPWFLVSRSLTHEKNSASKIGTRPQEHFLLPQQIWIILREGNVQKDDLTILVNNDWYQYFYNCWMHPKKILKF